MAKKGLYIIIVIILLIFFTTNVHAVGIISTYIGARYDFSPNMHIVQDYQIHSTSSRTLDYQPYANGDLAGYVTFDPPVLKNVPPGAYAPFKATINLPYKIEEPGIHNLYIGVMELFEPGQGAGGRTAVENRVEIRVLFPEPYLKASLDIPNGNSNEFLTCAVGVENWGEPVINNVKATINILDMNNQTITSLRTDETSLQRGEYGQLTALLDTFGMTPGEYHADAVIDWDGRQKTAEDTFKLGQLDANIISYTAEFEKNKLNPFDIEVESNWGNPIQNVYAVIELPNKKLQTPSKTLQPWSKEILTTYWDTTPLESGKYDAAITLHYASETKINPVDVWIVEEISKTERRPLTTLNTSMLLFIIILILIIFNLIWLYYRYKKRKR
jgi:hypothetical protein